MRMVASLARNQPIIMRNSTRLFHTHQTMRMTGPFSMRPTEAEVFPLIIFLNQGNELKHIF